MSKSIRKFFNRNLARKSFLFISLASAAFFLYAWRLGSLVPGYSQSEKTSQEASANLSVILSDPLLAPHKLLQMTLTRLGDSAVWSRLPSVILGVLFLLCLFFVLKRWFGKMTAVLATLLFATLPWIVLTLRSSTTTVMYLSGILVVAAYVWLTGTQRKNLALFGITMAAIFVIYTPGMFLFIVLAGIIWRRKIKDSLEPVSKLAVMSSVLALILSIVPIALASIIDLQVLKSALLIPNDFPNIIGFFKSLAWGPINLIWAARDSHPLVLGDMPLLSITAAAISVFGIYILWKRARSELYILLGLVLTAILGYAANRKLEILTIAFPAVGIMMGAGLRYLYAEWRSVFPSNPIPKALALVLIISLVVLNSIFGIRYSLLAWPDAQPTKKSFVLK